MDPKLRSLIDSVTAKRARVVLDHILKHGKITTYELKEVYGYSHPPRAASDVRDQGIPLRTTSETGLDGRPMAVYSIDEDAVAGKDKHGRRALPKALKDSLVARDGERCALCAGSLPSRALQVDHRIPYRIGGESATLDPAAFMLVCGSCNRAKSWSCEHCPNWLQEDAGVCASCLWASPTTYAHVATEPKRRLDLVWEGDEVRDFDLLSAQGDDVRALAKRIIRRALRGA